MARGFLSGAVLGLAVSVGAAVGLSLLTGGPVLRDTVPETAVREAAVPETAVPETVVPETAVPETAVPEAVVPETVVSETAVPETAMPEAAVPETAVPETAMPVATAPDASALDTPVEPKIDPASTDQSTSLPDSQPVPASDTAPGLDAPDPEAETELAALDTDPGNKPEAGAAQTEIAAPVDSESPSPALSAGQDKPVSPAAGADAPQAPQVETAPSVSTEPAQRQVAATPAEPADEADAEPGAENASEPAPAAPAPVVQSDAPSGLQAPQVTAQESQLVVALGSAEGVQDSGNIGKPASPAAPGLAPDVATEPAVKPPQPAASEVADDNEAPSQTAEAPAAFVEESEARQEDARPEPEPDAKTAEAVTQPGAEAEPGPPPAGAPQPGQRIQVGKPASNFKSLTTGVQTGRLPSVGSDGQADNRLTLAGESQGATPGQGAEPKAAEPAGETADAPPVKRFASPVQVPEGKPKMSIVLIDEGNAPAEIAALSRFPYPLSFAVDTSRDDAAERMAVYRAAGFEVLAMVALPKGAKPTDVEVAMPVLMGKVPEAVGVMEAPGNGIQFDRKVSDQVARILADTGHGLLLFPKGLNTAQKLAAKNGVPSAVIFRDIDDKGQKPDAIRRFLNYGTLNAGNEGGVVMVGRLRPETIEALLLWRLEDRAEQVALTPVSQLLQVQQ